MEAAIRLAGGAFDPAGTVTAVAGGLVAVVGSVWLVRAFWRARDQSQSSSTFVGAGVFPLSNQRWSELRRNLTYPLVVAHLGADEVRIEVTPAGRAFASAIEPPIPALVRLPYEELVAVEMKGGSFHFRTGDPDDGFDGVTFWAKRKDRDVLLAGLRDRDVPVRLAG